MSTHWNKAAQNYAQKNRLSQNLFANCLYQNYTPKNRLPFLFCALARLWRYVGRLYAWKRTVYIDSFSGLRCWGGANGFRTLFWWRNKVSTNPFFFAHIHMRIFLHRYNSFTMQKNRQIDFAGITKRVFWRQNVFLSRIYFFLLFLGTRFLFFFYRGVSK